ncbi:hypothetical protein [Streptomyces sp. 3N207]|uniref:hypothetical protein n=1 Tax=Streptomyces sp. 3N207 TaxID=3457417 RepID=UPI003FD486DC
MDSTGNTLLVVERAHRGAVESQFANPLYFARELHRQSGGVDILLRGLAASLAVCTGFRPALRIAARTLDTLPSPQRSLHRLIEDGAAVWVEEPDIAALGPGARERLLPGVRTVARHAVTARWPAYRRIWFF